MLNANEAAGLDFKATADTKLRIFETMNVASVAVGYGATFISHIVGKKLHCHLYARGISQRYITLNSFWVDSGQGYYYFSTDLN